MKRNELKMLIRAAAALEMPNVLGKISLDNISMIPDSVPEAAKPRFRLSFVHVLKLAIVFLMLGFTSFFIYDTLINQPSTPAVVLASEAEVYGFQMITAASFLETVNPLAWEILPLAYPDESPLISAEIEDLTTYLNIMETMIGDPDRILYTISTPSGREGYEFLLDYSSVDLLGNAIDYQIYFNQSINPENPSQTLLEGIMVKSGIEYALMGTVLKTGGVARTTFKAMINEDNYVLVTDKTTEAGQKYEYIVFENGVLTVHNNISLVLEEEKVSVIIEYERGDSSIEYKISKVINEDMTETLRVKYEVKTGEDEESGDIDVDLVEGQTAGTYQYHYHVQSQHGNDSSNHEYSGDRSDKVEDEGEDDSDEENPEEGTPEDDNPEDGGNGYGEGEDHGSDEEKGKDDA